MAKLGDKERKTMIESSRKKVALSNPVERLAETIRL